MKPDAVWIYTEIKDLVGGLLEAVREIVALGTVRLG